MVTWSIAALIADDAAFNGGVAGCEAPKFATSASIAATAELRKLGSNVVRSESAHTGMIRTSVLNSPLRVTFRVLRPRRMLALELRARRAAMESGKQQRRAHQRILFAAADALNKAILLRKAAVQHVARRVVVGTLHVSARCDDRF